VKNPAPTVRKSSLFGDWPLEKIL